MKPMVCVLALALAGCAGQISNSQANSPTGAVVYPISADDADRVIGQAMVETFPGTPISAVALPNKGYTATIRLLLDSHQITATAIPAAGVDAQGARVNGYSFDVSNSGTMPLTASARSDALFKLINTRAAALHPAIPAATR